jgi:hypothetical protein
LIATPPPAGLLQVDASGRETAMGYREPGRSVRQGHAKAWSCHEGHRGQGLGVRRERSIASLVQSSREVGFVQSFRLRRTRSSRKDQGPGVRGQERMVYHFVRSTASLVLPLCSFYRSACAELVRDVGNLLPLGPARQAFNQPNRTNRTNETNLTNYPKRTSWSRAPAIYPLLSACCLLNSDSYLLAPSAFGPCAACRGRERSSLAPT